MAKADNGVDPARNAAASLRRSEIISIAMRVFVEKGFAKASMREVADRAGILSGSLYHHFESKDALYLEAHELALIGTSTAIRQAISTHTDPWHRLSAACVCVLKMLIEPESPTVALMSELPRVDREIREQLVTQRDRFEALFVDLVDALPLPPQYDRTIYRILLLTILNAARSWLREGKLSTEQVADQIVMIFKGDPNYAFLALRDSVDT